MSRHGQTRHQQIVGFTLVELLVVMAVISILAGLLLPALQKTLKMARRTFCESSIKQLYVAAAMYSDERDGILVWGVSTTDRSSWQFRIHGYLDCAHDPETIDASASVKGCLLGDGCPFSAIDDNYRNSYGLNTCLATMTAWPRIHQRGKHPPTMVVYFVDCWMVKADRWTGLNSNSELVRTLDGTPTNYANIPVHGGDGLGTVFVDGHTGFLTRDDILYGHGRTHISTYW